MSFGVCIFKPVELNRVALKYVLTQHYMELSALT